MTTLGFMRSRWGVRSGSMERNNVGMLELGNLAMLAS
jgi:hypothetical protein